MMRYAISACACVVLVMVVVGQDTTIHRYFKIYTDYKENEAKADVTYEKKPLLVRAKNWQVKKDKDGYLLYSSVYTNQQTDYVIFVFSPSEKEKLAKLKMFDELIISVGDIQFMEEERRMIMSDCAIVKLLN